MSKEFLYSVFSNFSNQIGRSSLKDLESDIANRHKLIELISKENLETGNSISQIRRKLSYALYYEKKKWRQNKVPPSSESQTLLSDVSKILKLNSIKYTQSPLERKRRNRKLSMRRPNH